MRKLAIITTHPVQYYAPVFKLLHKRQNIGVRIFYSWGEASQQKFDPGFGQFISWDIPLLDGYNYEWADNVASNPGSHHFKGIITPGLIAQVENYKPDAVLVFGWAYEGHLRAIRHFKNKVPVYFRGDSTLLDKQPGIMGLLKSFLLRWIYSHIDHAFYAGTNNKAYFKKYGLKEQQLSFAPHAVDNERFSLDRGAETIQLRQNLGLTADDILILFSGKMEDKKSPAMLLKIFLAANIPKTHLLFVGSGKLESTLRQLAAEQINVHFLPFQNQAYMPVVYQCCDLFCLPSEGPGETWGLAVNEAMAAGKAILVSNKVGCAIDLVSDQNGAIFHSENQQAFTTWLVKLTKSRENLVKLGKSSKNIIQKWSFNKIAENIENQLLK